MRAGGQGVLVSSPRPPSNLKSTFEKYNITWFTGINTLFAAMMAEPSFDRKMFENFRFCGSGGVAQQADVAAQWQDMTGMRINQGYGITEISGILTLNPPVSNRFGKLGIPVPGAEIRIIDDEGNDVPLGQPGEVVARRPALMKGYLIRADGIAEAIREGWLFSGHTGVIDEDGFSGNRGSQEGHDPGDGLQPLSQRNRGWDFDGSRGNSDRGDRYSRREIGRNARRLCRPGRRQRDRRGDPGGLPRKNDQLYKIPKRVPFVDEVSETLSSKVKSRQLREDYLK